MVLFGKEDLPIYNGPFYIGLIGGISSLIYPDFISQGTTIFQLNTIMGLLHHGYLFILCLAMLIFNWFRPSIKNCYYFPLTICIYITVGVFAIYKLGLKTAMLVDTPILSGTIIDIWFILIFGTILDYLVAFIYEVITKKIKFKFHE